MCNIEYDILSNIYQSLSYIMLKKIDESLYPFTLNLINGEYVPPFETVTVKFDNPDHFITEFFCLNDDVDIQRSIDKEIEQNDTYIEWKSHFKSVFNLPHIKKYMQTYSSSKYYEDFGKHNLQIELESNVLPLPRDQFLFRGCSHKEIPLKWEENEEFLWELPRSTTLNLGVAKKHAFIDCTDENQFEPLLDLPLIPTVLAIKIADDSVEGYVFNYEECSDSKHEKEVLLSPNITLIKLKEIEFDSIKVIYVNAFGNKPT
ncbi:hypothetical protein D3C78_96890 [compost metagenome]